MQKKKHIRPILSLITGLSVLLLSGTPKTALAETTDVIYISSAEDLVACFKEEHLFDDFILTNNIDISGVIDSVVGRYLHGTFEGNGYTISGLHGERPLFEQVVDGTLTNLTIDGALEIMNGDGSYGFQVGGICCNNGGLIENCVNSVDITSNNILTSAGGIAEQNSGNGMIRNCRNEGVLYGKLKQAGGIVGLNWGLEISGCENVADIIITIGSEKCGVDVGGIIGSEMDGSHGEPISDYFTVSNCKNSGDIRLIGEERTILSSMGGIIGLAELKGIAATSAITNCENTGTIYGYGTIGGIVGCVNLHQKEGLLGGVKVPYYGKIEIDNCWNSGTIYGRYFPDCNTIMEAGGVVGNIQMSNSSTVSVSNSSNSGSILKEPGYIPYYIGGVIGSIDNYDYEAFISDGTVNVANCQNKGFLEPQAYKVSDIVAVTSGSNIAAEEKEYVGDTFKADADGNLRAYRADGTPIINQFVCDGKYTYYFQADGTAMKNRLTYHPDGDPKHVIYFDEHGHEVFSNFANVKQTIAGDKVDDYCFFDVYGYLYVDVVTYDQTGTKLYYANPYGVMDRGKWFAFSDSVVWADGTPFDKAGGNFGYANRDGSLLINTWTYDWNGIKCYMQGNGVALY